MGFEFIAIALTLGLISSFHCVGMCGAIAFSLPITTLPPKQKIIGIILYNLGRVVTYAFFGLVFGLIGRQIFLAGIQQWFTILAGISLLAVVGYIFISRKTLKFQLFKNNHFLFSFIGKKLQQPGLWNTFLIGLANGFLPCGMVYLAITGAVATGVVGKSVLFMALFGLGTIPAMFALNIFGFVAGLQARNLMKKLTPFVMAFMGILLILRGLNLGIPYLSPNADGFFRGAASCH